MTVTLTKEGAVMRRLRKFYVMAEGVLRMLVGDLLP